jgi:Zn-dependent protease
VVNIGVKKIVANYLQCSVETKIWTFRRYGVYERSYFKNAVPAGILLPFLIAFLSLGKLYWLGTTQSEISALKSRAAKRHDFYSFSELTEWHMALIPAYGIIACLVLAVFGYIAGYTLLGRLAVLFAFFNMFPLGQLDGTKIFFGSPRMWFVLAVLSLIGAFWAIFLI